MPALNLSLDYFEHPKTRRLVGLLGKGAAELPIRLWIYCGKFHAEDGRLTGYSAQEIESAVQWWGKSGAMVEAMRRVGFLEQELDGTFIVHDWLEHAGHIAAYMRKGKAMSAARWDTVSNAGKHSKQCLQDTASNPTNIPASNAASNATSIPTSNARAEQIEQKERALSSRSGDINTTDSVKDNHKRVLIIKAFIMGAQIKLSTPTAEAVYQTAYAKAADNLLAMTGDDIERACTAAKDLGEYYVREGKDNCNPNWLLTDFPGWDEERIEYERKIQAGK